MKKWEDPNLEYVEIHTSFDTSEEVQNSLVAALAEYQKSWPKRDLDTLGVQMYGDEMLVSHLSISHHSDPHEEGHVLFQLDIRKREALREISTRRRRSLESKVLSIQRALDAIGSLSVQCNAHCTVAWRFLADSVSSIVQLPLLKVSVPGTPFGQVSGVRFTPADAESHQYVVLDLIGGKDLHLSSHFVLSSILSFDILERVVVEGQKIKSAFVNEGTEFGGDS